MNLEGYRLIFEDDFNGTELNTEVWRYRGTGKQRIANCHPSQVRVENGNLIIKCEYLNAGAEGEGWYTGQISLKEWFCRGYFEAKMLCNDPGDNGFWSAFWLQAKHPYTAASCGGIHGAEIDIVEAFRTPEGYPAAMSNIHCAGYHDGSESNGIRSQCVAFKRLPDCYSAYHVFGLEWTEEAYRIFIDDVCVGVSTWADGVNVEEDELIFSLCAPEKDPGPDAPSGELIADWVRVYKKED